MNNIIGMLVLVDSAAIIRDYNLHNYRPPNPENEKIPVFCWHGINKDLPYIKMVADKKHVVSGQGTINLSVKAAPGDEIRWWKEDIFNNSNLDFVLKTVSPTSSSAQEWEAYYETPPKLHYTPEKESPSTIALIGRNRFWAAAYSSFRFQTKIKEDAFLNRAHINMGYYIDLQVSKKAGHNLKPSPICVFRWYPKIQVNEKSSVNAFIKLS